VRSLVAAVLGALLWLLWAFEHEHTGIRAPWTGVTYVAAASAFVAAAAAVLLAALGIALRAALATRLHGRARGRPAR